MIRRYQATTRERDIFDAFESDSKKQTAKNPRDRSQNFNDYAHLWISPELSVSIVRVDQSRHLHESLRLAPLDSTHRLFIAQGTPFDTVLSRGELYSNVERAFALCDR